MGMKINETILAELHWKDVALIAVALKWYIDNSGKQGDAEQIERARNLIDRLGNQL